MLMALLPAASLPALCYRYAYIHPGLLFLEFHLHHKMTS
ncbi:hypothetical protein FORC82_p297 (plasmid) [Escherichia coli]|uniref:Uncharacterized protein n=1 Tax=Salmonella enterica subsp. enterica serovar Montevideo str. S5-403 TaxID=913242 RepID=G5PXA3_SALMO|nr:hypothetical protein LTSEMON_6372 [Salmonella enterica subsp. enterica serovar Montevideo str. S5-403]QAZ74818.1 hypothetical protein FORC82_p297 [Escherichia coli]